MKQHAQDVAPHQHPNNIQVNEGWEDFGEVQKLLEDRKKRKAEPDIKLFLGEVDGVVRLLLDRGGFAVCQENRNVVRDAKAVPELPFKKKLGTTFRLSLFGTHTLLATFLALTDSIGRSSVPSC